MDLVDKYKSVTSDFEQIEKEINKKYPHFGFRDFIFSALNHYATNEELKSHFSKYNYNMFCRFAIDDSNGILELLNETNESNFDFCLKKHQSLTTFKIFVDNISRFNKKQWISWVCGMMDLEKIKYLCENTKLPKRISDQLLFLSYSSCNREIYIYLKSLGYTNQLLRSMFFRSYINENLERFNFLMDLEPEYFEIVKPVLIKNKKEKSKLNVFLI